ECLADLQDETAPLERAEAGQLRRNLVLSRNQLRREVAAIGTRGELTNRTGIFACDENSHAGQNRSLRVGHLPADFRCALLRVEWECRRTRERPDDDRTNQESAHRCLLSRGGFTQRSNAARRYERAHLTPRQGANQQISTKMSP